MFNIILTGKILDEIQFKKLIDKIIKLKKEKKINQIILSIQNENAQKSSLPTAQIFKIKKTMKLIIQIKLILEQLELKFSTVKKTNDVIQTISLAIETTKQIQNNYHEINQQYKKNILKLSDELNDLLLNNLNCKNIKFTSKYVDKETKNILQETSLIADNIIKHNLPKLPSEFNILDKE